jgi:RES domain-containing protein
MPDLQPALVAKARRAAFAGTAYRNQAPGFDPTSGEGARRHGGRFNPPRSFPVLYLCATRPCVVAELAAQATRQGLEVVDLLPRELWAIEIDLDSVLDLGDPDVRRGLRLEIADLIRPDHGLTREIGEIAHEQRLQAIRSPSATDVDEIIALFPENLGAATLSPRLEQVWRMPADLGV